MEITHEFEMASMDAPTTFDAHKSAKNLADAIKAEVLKFYPNAEVEVDYTVGTYGAPDQTTAEPYDPKTIEHVQEIAQRVWDRQMFEWVELSFWRKDSQLHVQSGFDWGNDITLEDDAEWGTYTPMSDEEHVKAGYEKIDTTEAEALLDEIGIEIKQ